MARPVKVDRAELLRLRRLGLSVGECARRVECTKDYAGFILRKLGMSGKMGRPKDDRNWRALWDLVEGGMRVPEAADKVGYNRKYAYRVLGKMRENGGQP